MKSAAFLSCRPISAPHVSVARVPFVSPRHKLHFQSARSLHRRPPVRSALSLSFNISPSVVAGLTSGTVAATPFAIWTVLLGAATLGLTSQRYSWGRSLSAPMVSTLCTLVLSNVGLMPVANPIYDAITSFLVPLAVPLLLLGADLRRVVLQTGRLLKVFFVGIIATTVGTLAAWYLVPIKSIGSSAWKIAAALNARHIGGAINYVAVVEATKAPADMVTAALTADNVLVPVYFVVLLLLARHVSQPSEYSSKAPDRTVDENCSLNDTEDAPKEGIMMTDAAVAICLSGAMCTLASFISAIIPVSLGVVPVVTAIVVTVATLMPKQMARYQKAGSAIGVFFMQVFFAVAGAGGSIMSVLARAPVLFMFSCVQLAVHLLFLLAAGKIFRFHRAEVIIASNANVGGPSTAAAMAGSKSWDALVVPALLVGVFGYVVATFASLCLGHGVLRHL